jgi:hypothetical protein
VANTPTRPFRIPDDVYEAAQARAKAEGVTLTAVVVTALRSFAEGATRNLMPTTSTRTKGTARSAEIA